MNSNMLDMLVCHIYKHFPLELLENKSEDEIIVEGTLYCEKCSRFFPIIDEIPIMLPDELRDKKQDIEFLKRNTKELPEKIITKALPWHL